MAEAQVQTSSRIPIDELSPPPDVRCLYADLQIPLSNLMSSMFSYRRPIAAVLKHLQQNFCTVQKQNRPLCQLLIFLLVFSLNQCPFDIVRRFIRRHSFSSSAFVHCVLEMVALDNNRLRYILGQFYDANYVYQHFLCPLENIRLEIDVLVQELKNENHITDSSSFEAKAEIDSFRKSTTIGSFLTRPRLPPFVPIPVDDGISESAILAMRRMRKKNRGEHTKSISKETASNCKNAEISVSERNDAKIMPSSIFIDHLHGSDGTLAKTTWFRNRKAPIRELPIGGESVSASESIRKHHRLQLLDKVRQERHDEIARKSQLVTELRRNSQDRTERCRLIKKRGFDPTSPSKTVEGLFSQMTYFELQLKSKLQKQFDELVAENQRQMVQRSRERKRSFAQQRQKSGHS